MHTQLDQRWDARSLASAQYRARVNVDTTQSAIIVGTSLVFLVETIKVANRTVRASTAAQMAGEPHTPLVQRRFEDFLWLRKQLVTQCQGKVLPALPPRPGVVISSEALEFTRDGLQRFLNRLMADPNTLGRDALLFFLNADTQEMQQTNNETFLKRAVRTLQPANGINLPSLPVRKHQIDTVLREQDAKMCVVVRAYKQCQRGFRLFRTRQNNVTGTTAHFLVTMLPLFCPLSQKEFDDLHDLYCEELSNVRAHLQVQFEQCVRDIYANARAVREVISQNKRLYEQYTQSMQKLVKAREREAVLAKTPDAAGLAEVTEQANALSQQRDELQKQYLAQIKALDSDVKSFLVRRQRNMLQAVLILCSLQKTSNLFELQFSEWLLSRIEVGNNTKFATSAVDVPHALTMQSSLILGRPTSSSRAMHLAPTCTPDAPSKQQVKQGLSLQSLTRVPPRPRMSFRSYATTPKTTSTMSLSSSETRANDPWAYQSEWGGNTSASTSTDDYGGFNDDNFSQSRVTSAVAQSLLQRYKSGVTEDVGRAVASVANDNGGEDDDYFHDDDMDDDRDSAIFNVPSRVVPALDNGSPSASQRISSALRVPRFDKSSRARSSSPNGRAALQEKEAAALVAPLRANPTNSVPRNGWRVSRNMGQELAQQPSSGGEDDIEVLAQLRRISSAFGPES